MTHELPGYLALADELERAQKPLPIVFGHNDLLPANFLDDGEQAVADRFRICRLQHRDVRSCRRRLERRHERRRIRRIARPPISGASRTQAIRRSHAAMQCASLLREAMWSMVSELHLDAPGVDYVAYTAENLARLDAALDAYRTTYGKICSMTLPTPCRDRRHRRRHHRLLDRLPSGARPQGRRRAARTGQADLGLDLACGRAGRPVALVGLDHPRAQIFGRSLQGAGGRDRARHRLEDDRLPAARHQPGPLDRIQPAGDDGQELRHGHAAALAGRGEGDVAADGRPATSSAPPGCRPTARRAPPTSRSRWPRARACMAPSCSRTCASPASR